MSRKPVREFEGGSKKTLPSGTYRFEITDLKVVDGSSGYCYPVLDVMVIGPEAQKELYGKHCELGFSLSPNSASAKPWLEALGFDEDDEIEVNDSVALDAQLRKAGVKGTIISATIEKGKDKSGKYDQNSVTPPWEVYPADRAEGDYREPGEDRPDF